MNEFEKYWALLFTGTEPGGKPSTVGFISVNGRRAPVRAADKNIAWHFWLAGMAHERDMARESADGPEESES